MHPNTLLKNETMKKLSIAITLLLAIPFAMQAQLDDVAYLDNYLEVCKKKEATFVKKVIAHEGDVYEGHVESLNGDIRVVGFYRDKQLTVEHGKFSYYHENGKLESQGMYTHGKKTGVWKRFDQFGNPKADKIYDASVLNNITYSKVTEQPVFNADYVSLSDYLTRSVQNSGKKIRGSMKAEFIVEKDGSVSDVYLLEGVDASVDAEIKNALNNMPKWTPGKNKGQHVRVAMNFEMKF